MQVNNITVPDEGTTTEYIPDPIGGWMYVVTTRVSVEQKSLPQVQTTLAEAKQRLVEAQALVAELEPHAVDFEKSIIALPPLDVVNELPLPAPVSATSTPIK